MGWVVDGVGWFRSDSSTTDAVDTFLATSAIGRDGAIACGFVGGSAVRLGRETHAELNVDSCALFTRVTRRAAHPVDTDEATVSIGGAEVGGTIVDLTAAVCAVASFAAIGVKLTAVHTAAVDTDVAHGALRVARALAGSRRNVATETSVALLTLGARTRIGTTLGGAASIDTKLPGTALEVELTDVFVGAALTIKAGKSIRAHSGVCAATTEFAARDIVGNTHSVTADEARVATIGVHRAGAGARVGIGLGRADTHRVTADRAIRAVRVFRALFDATQVGAHRSFGTLEIATTGRTLGRIDFTATQAIAVEATFVVAEVAVGTTTRKRHKRACKERCESQTHR